MLIKITEIGFHNKTILIYMQQSYNNTVTYELWGDD